jgi:hypothetical protein
MRPSSASHQRMAESHAETVASAWKSLYRVGGAAALITAVLVPIQIIVFVTWPPPLEGNAIDWFTLFHDNWFLGLLSLDLLLMADYVLLVPIVLALYVALRRVSESFTAIGTAFFFVTIAVYFASNTAFEMLSLAKQYTAAATDAERAMLLAAGEAMLATYQGTAFHVSYVLGSTAGIIMGVVMLRSNVFSRAIAYLMILGNVVGFGLYVPTAGIAISALSGVILWIWYILIARRFFQLGQGVSKEEANRS